MNLQQIVIQAMISFVPIAAAYFAYRQATNANRRTVESTERISIQNATLEREKVDATAYKSAQEIYESSLRQLREDLQQERDRNRYLQGRVDTLENEVRALRDHQSARETRSDGLDRKDL